MRWSRRPSSFLPLDLQRAVQALSRADDVEQVRSTVRAQPDLLTPAARAALEAQVDAIEQGAPGDWWGSTRAAALLRGVAEDDLEGAMLRVRTRDLLPLGPDDVRALAAQHPALLTEHVDVVLRSWADEEEADSERRRQIVLRRELLRELARERYDELYGRAMKAEDEHRRTGDLAPLEEAVELRRGLLREDAPFLDPLFREVPRQGLSRLLQQRYRVTRRLADLDDAIAEAAAGAASAEHDGLRRLLLSELGQALDKRYRDLGDERDCDAALAAFGEVARLPLLEGSDPDDALTDLVNLGTLHLDRHGRSGAREDLDEAERLAREVVARTPRTSPRRWLRLHNLACTLRTVGVTADDRAALQEAVALEREALETRCPDDRAHVLAGLGHALHALHAAGGPVDAPEVEQVLRDACREGLAVNLDATVWAGMSWGRSAWEARDWRAAAEAYGYVAQATRRGLRSQRQGLHQEIRLSQFREVGARAAYSLARSGREEEAVLAYELSRAQLLAEAMAERGLQQPGDSVPGGGVGPADVALSLDEVRSAARGRHIVYLVPTEEGGVALIVAPDSTSAVHLPGLTTAAVEHHVQEHLSGVVASAACRSWMWECVMEPVVRRAAGLPGLVVVPGGLLGLLPLGAASCPDPSRPTGACYALDAVPLTVAPSARALGGRPTPTVQGSTRCLVVADPATTEDPLLMARVEAEVVRALLRADVLAGRAATLTAVQEGLVHAQVVHLACHGRADLDAPLDGGLLLAGDALLTVRMLRDGACTDGLAVLSACESGVPGAHLPDEAVGLPSALLQAGASTVIASLWSVGDAATAMLMVELYRRMLRDGEPPALALRGAQQWLRDTTDAEKARSWETAASDWMPDRAAQWLLACVDAEAGTRSHADPAAWAPFVHVGA